MNRVSGPPGLWIGTSGWTYPSWAGSFYPSQLPDSRRLEYYSDRLDTVELNASYYHWPSDNSFRSWRRRLPSGFLLSVKAPRGLSHGRRLYEPEPWIARIQASLSLLGERFGVLLVQLPPDMERDDARLDYFLTALPAGLPVALELRHPSWQNDEVFDLLERHAAAYVVMSGAGLPCILRATTSFVYIRFHGPDNQHLYAGSYDAAAIRWWADRIAEWQEQGRAVFGYFNNDAGGAAAHNASALRSALSHQHR